MTTVRIAALAALVASSAATAALAVPSVGRAPVGDTPIRAVPVLYGYGPNPHGIYGHRRYHRSRSYGTGYHGRGTATGGPVGGPPTAPGHGIGT